MFGTRPLCTCCCFATARAVQALLLLLRQPARRAQGTPSCGRPPHLEANSLAAGDRTYSSVGRHTPSRNQPSPSFFTCLLVRSFGARVACSRASPLQQCQRTCGRCEQQARRPANPHLGLPLAPAAARRSHRTRYGPAQTIFLLFQIHPCPIRAVNVQHTAPLLQMAGSAAGMHNQLCGHGALLARPRSCRLPFHPGHAPAAAV